MLILLIWDENIIISLYKEWLNYGDWVVNYMGKFDKWFFLVGVFIRLLFFLGMIMNKFNIVFFCNFGYYSDNFFFLDFYVNYR